MENKKKFIIDVCYVGLILLIMILFCQYILPILIPFITAFVIASILQIPVNAICKKLPKYKRKVSLFVVIAFFVLAAFGAVAIGLKIIDSVGNFIIAAPSLYRNEIVPALDYVFNEITMAVDSWDISIAGDVEKAFHDFLNNIGNYITNLSMKAVGIVSGGIGAIPGVVIRLIVMIISCVFFMLDYDMIIAFIKKCIPAGKKELVKKVEFYTKKTIMIWLKSYAVLFLLTYAELTIGFTIIGIPYAPIVGLAVAIFDILPVLGTGGVLLPWAIILFIMKNIPMAVGMIVLYLVITIIRNTLEPKLVGEQIGLHPVATLIAMYLGLDLVGFFGMLLFPAALAIFINMKRNEQKEE